MSRIIVGSDESPEDTIKKIMNVNKEDIVNACKDVELDTVYFIRGNGQGGEEE